MKSLPSSAFLRRTRLAFAAGALAVCAFTGASAFAPHPSGPTSGIREAYDPTLGSVRTIDDALRILPSFLPAGTVRPTDVQKADAIDEFIRRRFVHGYSQYGPRDNWIAYLAGFAWDDLRAPVIAEDILDYAQAACSQQALLFQALLEAQGIDYASFGWRDPDHFTVAAKVGGTWRYYDPNQEIRARSVPVSAVMRGDALWAMYPAADARDYQAAVLGGRGRMSGINAYPAARAAAFHEATAWASRWGWLAGFAALGLAKAPGGLGGSAGRRLRARGPLRLAMRMMAAR